jgi:hypothetical protein
MLADLGKTTSAAPPGRDDDPLTSPSFSRKAGSATDSRSYSNARKNGSTNPSLTGLERERKNAPGRGKHRAAQPADDDAAMMPLAAPPAQHPSGPYPVAPAAAANGRYPAMPGQIPATAHPAQQHPSGPYPAAPAAQPASNGYGAGHPSGPYTAPAQHPATAYPAQQHPSGPHPAAPAAQPASNGYGARHPSGPYPVAHPNGGYAQDPASSGSWYNMPADAASLPGQGVSYARAGAARGPAGFADGHAAAGYAGGPDYAAPSYRGQAHADPRSRDPHRDAQPGEAPYPAGYGGGEYAEGYDSHRGEPYQADGYGGYAAQG